MAIVISCGALLGAWLLFLGAIYQATLELRAHVVERDRLASVASKIAVPPAVSPWWWLVPPWKFVLERRRASAYRRGYAEAMSLEDFTALLGFYDKGLGWSCVAVGALLLGANQTYTFSCDRGWSSLTFVLVTCGLTLGTVVLCVVRLSASQRLLEAKRRGGRIAL